MASSYSSQLRLELMAAGENDNTWGAKVNTVFEMIEDAIAGRAAVSMPADANYTLTTNNSAADEARCAILNIASGVSLSATRDVICPAVAKNYVVKNATTGGQSIRIKTSGGTGITIPNGKTAIVFCDGTNVNAGFDVIPGATVTGDLTMSGSHIIMSGALVKNDKSADIASGATVDLGNATGNMVTVTHAAGTTAITSLGGATIQAGTELTLYFSISGGTLTVTHDATNLVLPYGVSSMQMRDKDTLRVMKKHDSNAEWVVTGGTALTSLNEQATPEFTTGDGKLTLKTSADSGWVMCDDGTIGDATSGATTRANADTADLYALLWNNVSNTYAAVSGGRGANAAADFAAHKTIALTKQLGRAIAIAGTGSGLTARSLGQTLGEETHDMTIAEMPPHEHTTTPNFNLNVNGGSQFTVPTSGSVNTGTTGGGDPFNVMQPTTFWNVMLKL